MNETTNWAKCPRCAGDEFEFKTIVQLTGDQEHIMPAKLREEFVCVSCLYVISHPDDLAPPTFPVYIVSESLSRRAREVTTILGPKAAQFIGTRKDQGYYFDEDHTLLMITQKLWDEQQQKGVPLLPVSRSNYLLDVKHPPYKPITKERTNGEE